MYPDTKFDINKHWDQQFQSQQQTPQFQSQQQTPQFQSPQFQSPQQFQQQPQFQQPPFQPQQPQFLQPQKPPQPPPRQPAKQVAPATPTPAPTLPPIMDASSYTTLLVLALFLTATFLQPLLPAHSTRLLAHSGALRHAFGFLATLLVLNTTGVVPDSSLDATVPLGTLLMFGVVAYGVVLITSRITVYAWLLLAFLLGILALVRVYSTRVTHTVVTTETLEYIQAGAGFAAALTTFFGFLIYVGEKKLKYRESFSYATFLLGNESGGGKGDGSSATYGDALAAAFN